MQVSICSLTFPSLPALTFFILYHIKSILFIFGPHQPFHVSKLGGFTGIELRWRDWLSFSGCRAQINNCCFYPPHLHHFLVSIKTQLNIPSRSSISVLPCPIRYAPPSVHPPVCLPFPAASLLSAPPNLRHQAVRDDGTPFAQQRRGVAFVTFDWLWPAAKYL